MTEEKKIPETPETEETCETVLEEPATAEADAGKKDQKKDKKSETNKLKAEIESLKKSLEAEKLKAEEASAQVLRIAAEYDNFRKRSQNERKNIYGEAVSDTLAGLLPIIDNLQYAAKYSAGDAEKVAEGLNMILSKLPETLEKMNIQMFGEAGETFDPALHNAVLHVDDESYGDGEIVEVLQCGYKYGDKVLRYAMVKTAN